VKRELRLRPTKKRLANFTPLRLCRYFNSYDNRFAAKWRRGLGWKSGRKTANACDKSEKDTSMDAAAHFIFAVKNTFIEGRSSLCNRAANPHYETLSVAMRVSNPERTAGRRGTAVRTSPR